jgi:hypothetical protein
VSGVPPCLAGFSKKRTQSVAAWNSPGCVTGSEILLRISDNWHFGGNASNTHDGERMQNSEKQRFLKSSENETHICESWQCIQTCRWRCLSCGGVTRLKNYFHTSELRPVLYIFCKIKMVKHFISDIRYQRCQIRLYL